MKTEQALSTQQYNVEQSALFPKNALEPETTTGIIEIPDHDPVIFPGIDSAEHFDVTGLSAEKKSEFIETVHVVRNMAREAVYGAQRTGAGLAGRARFRLRDAAPWQLPLPPDPCAADRSPRRPGHQLGAGGS